MTLKESPHRQQTVRRIIETYIHLNRKPVRITAAPNASTCSRARDEDGFLGEESDVAEAECSQEKVPRCAIDQKEVLAF